MFDDAAHCNQRPCDIRHLAPQTGHNDATSTPELHNLLIIVLHLLPVLRHLRKRFRSNPLATAGTSGKPIFRLD